MHPLTYKLIEKISTDPKYANEAKEVLEAEKLHSKLARIFLRQK